MPNMGLTTDQLILKRFGGFGMAAAQWRRAARELSQLGTFCLEEWA